MLADPASAAAQALGVSVTIEHGEWLDLIENELLGSSGLQGDYGEIRQIGPAEVANARPGPARAHGRLECLRRAALCRVLAAVSGGRQVWILGGVISASGLGASG